MRQTGAPGRQESEKERVDRNLSELLGELRVALPGVQVLFAFLLVVPFNQRFAQATEFQERIFLLTLLCTALASVLLIAPSVHHRLLFRQQQKEYLVQRANRLSIAGLSFLAVAMTGVVLLVSDFVFGPATTAIVTASVAVAFALVWYALPLRRRRG